MKAPAIICCVILGAATICQGAGANEDLDGQVSQTVAHLHRLGIRWDKDLEEIARGDPADFHSIQIQLLGRLHEMFLRQDEAEMARYFAENAEKISRETANQVATQLARRSIDNPSLQRFVRSIAQGNPAVESVEGGRELIGALKQSTAGLPEYANLWTVRFGGWQDDAEIGAVATMLSWCSADPVFHAFAPVVRDGDDLAEAFMALAIVRPPADKSAGMTAERLSTVAELGRRLGRLLQARETAIQSGAAPETAKLPALRIKTVGFNRVELTAAVPGRIERQVMGGILPQYGLGDNDLKGRLIASDPKYPYLDTLPVSLAEVRYRYVIVDRQGHAVAAAETSRAWPEALFPRVILPGRPGWTALYRKACELTWRRIVTSKALPNRFAYCDYPGSDFNCVWDSCFTSLAQRYAAISGAHPGMATLDNFYAQQTPEGFINRLYRPSDYKDMWSSRQNPSITGTNPPLFAWAEWNYYRMSGDRARLAAILPRLIRHYEFVESFLQETPGRYVWNIGGSGWDNILEAEPTKYFVELPAMQALAARHIARMAEVLGQGGIRRRFEAEVEKKRGQIEPYWNKDKNWYCSLDLHGRFTGKTLAGMWPVLAGIVPHDHLAAMVQDNLMNPDRFFTQPMPLPTLAKDEHGYDPSGGYWRGSIWINMSLMTVRGLDEHGFPREAFELATRTLDGMSRVYDEWLADPHTLWECYAPEIPAPSFHFLGITPGPEQSGKGLRSTTVRGDFGGWTTCLINLLIENVMGIQVDAPNNTITWTLRLKEQHGIENLRFGQITTSLLRQGSTLTVRSNAPYTLKVISGGQSKGFPVLAGGNRLAL